MSISVLAKPTCFHHPVKVLFLDDNQAFLNVLSMEFGQKENFIMLTDPDEAMHLINQSREGAVESNLLKNKNNTDDAPCVNNNSLLDLIYEQSRFDNVAVLVVDYEMPAINGVEFCEKLKGKTIFKILLTAEADKDIAISAFNNGTIDKFILKTNDNLYAELLNSIDELTNRYFNEQSQIPLKISDDSLKSLFNDEQYKKVFHEIKRNGRAVEYYLVDGVGSFLFLSKNAEPTWLIVSDKRKAHEQAELLMGYGFTPDAIQKIKSQDSILFLLSDSEYKEPASQWGKYMFEAKRLDENYSYSVVHGALVDSIRWEDVTPYEDAHAL